MTETAGMRRERGSGRYRRAERTVYLFMAMTEGSPMPHGMVMAGAMQEIERQGYPYELIVCPYYYNALKEKYSLFSGKYCCGAVIFGQSESDMEELEQQEFEIPVVVYNCVSGRYPSVYVDNYAGGRMAAQLFARKGLKRVGLVSSECPNKASALRVLGFEEGCRQTGLLLRPEHIAVCGLSEAGGQEAIHRILGFEERPEAVFVTTDGMALGVLKELWARGIRIPGQMEVLAFGGGALNKVAVPSLSCVFQPVEEMSAACISLLHMILTSGKSEQISRIFPMEIRYGDSCTAPAAVGKESGKDGVTLERDT